MSNDLIFRHQYMHTYNTHRYQISDLPEIHTLTTTAWNAIIVVTYTCCISKNSISISFAVVRQTYTPRTITSGETSFQKKFPLHSDPAVYLGRVRSHRFSKRTFNLVRNRKSRIRNKHLLLTSLTFSVSFNRIKNSILKTLVFTSKLADFLS